MEKKFVDLTHSEKIELIKNNAELHDRIFDRYLQQVTYYLGNIIFWRFDKIDGIAYEYNYDRCSMYVPGDKISAFVDAFADVYDSGEIDFLDPGKMEEIRDELTDNQSRWDKSYDSDDDVEFKMHYQKLVDSAVDALMAFCESEFETADDVYDLADYTSNICDYDDVIVNVDDWFAYEIKIKTYR